MRPNRFLILSLVPLFAAPAFAQQPQQAQSSPDPQRDQQQQSDVEAARRGQVAAAVEDGVAALRRDVYGTPFSVDLTIRQAARRLSAFDPLDKAIQTAEQRGGPRWREDRRTCEVRLELPGSAVAAVMQDAGAKQFGTLGLTSDGFARAIAHLRTQRFSATGVAAAGAATNVVERPADAAAAAPAWRTIPEPARTEALHNAKNDAAGRLMDGLRAVPLGGGRTMADALAQPAVAGEIRRRLADRPATGIEYGNDLAVRLRLSAGPDDVWPVVQQALEKHKLGPAPDDADGWRRLRGDVVNAMPAAAPLGRGVPPQRAGAPAGNQKQIPRDPPAWVARQMDADGQGPGSGLKAARAAEAIAHAQLRAQVEALELSPGLTLAEAAKRDPRVARALSDALGRARVSRVTYGGDSVGVRVNVDLDWVWRALAAIE